jgi:endonuclease VIII
MCVAADRWVSVVPEGHTIHRAAQDQRKMLAGQKLSVASPQGRFFEGAALLDERTCVTVEAYGKHLIYQFDNAAALHIHLGLFGRFRTAKTPAAEPKGEVRVRMMSKTHVVDINGPNTCEVLDPEALRALVQRIGPDVLRRDADPGLAWARISKSRVGIGQLLMDQSVMAGIGNIYRSEILWRQGVHPNVPGNQISRDVFDMIWTDAVQLLEIGVKNNAIITVDGAQKSRTRYAERVNIFGKTTCPTCDGDIRKFEIATRRAFVCETCQPNPSDG